MTLEKIIGNLYEIDGKIKSGKSVIIDMDNLIRSLEDDLRSQNAKKSGCGSALAACKRILKDGKLMTNREALKYPVYIEDYQIVSNGYLLVKYNKGHHIPLENKPDDLEGMEKQFQKIIKDFENKEYISVELPELKTLSSRIKIEKGKSRDDKPLYQFNECDYAFNMFYIEQSMIALGGKNLNAEVDNKNLALKISGENGVAYIVACRLIDNACYYTKETL